VLEVMYLCVRDMDFASFYALKIERLENQLIYGHVITAILLKMALYRYFPYSYFTDILRRFIIIIIIIVHQS
jgi:hypothetical protein